MSYIIYIYICIDIATGMLWPFNIMMTLSGDAGSYIHLNSACNNPLSWTGPLRMKPLSSIRFYNNPAFLVANLEDVKRDAVAEAAAPVDARPGLMEGRRKAVIRRVLRA